MKPERIDETLDGWLLLHRPGIWRFFPVHCAVSIAFCSAASLAAFLLPISLARLPDLSFHAMGFHTLVASVWILWAHRYSRAARYFRPMPGIAGARMVLLHTAILVLFTTPAWFYSTGLALRVDALVGAVDLDATALVDVSTALRMQTPSQFPYDEPFGVDPELDAYSIAAPFLSLSSPELRTRLQESDSLVATRMMREALSNIETFTRLRGQEPAFMTTGYRIIFLVFLLYIAVILRMMERSVQNARVMNIVFFPCMIGASMYAIGINVPLPAVNVLPLVCLGVLPWLVAFGVWDLVSPMRINAEIEFAAGLLVAPLAVGYLIASMVDPAEPIRWTLFGTASLAVLLLITPWLETLAHRISARPTH